VTATATATVITAMRATKRLQQKEQGAGGSGLLPARKTLDWKKGGAILRVHKKKDFGAIPYFLEIANVGEAYLILRELVYFQKCILQTGPTD